MAVLYVEEIGPPAVEGDEPVQTGVVYRVDTEDFIAVRIAVFDDLEHMASFMRAWNGEGQLDPQ